MSSEKNVAFRNITSMKSEGNPDKFVKKTEKSATVRVTSPKRCSIGDGVFEPGATAGSIKRSKSEEDLLHSQETDEVEGSTSEYPSSSTQETKEKKSKSGFRRLITGRFKKSSSEEGLESNTDRLDEGVGGSSPSRPYKRAVKRGFFKGSKEDKLSEHLLFLQREAEAGKNELLSSIFTEIEKLDTWTSKEKPFRKWSDIVNDSSEPEKTLVDLGCVKDGYSIEFGHPKFSFSPHNHVIEEAEKDVPYYKNTLFKSDQINFVFDGEDDKVVGPICLSIEAFGSGKDDEQKAILRSKKGTFRFFIPSCNSNKEALKVVKTMFPELANIKFTETYHPDLPQRLVDYEAQGIIRRYKFGVLYVKDGQTDENDMFSNNEMSHEFEEFLDFLGERVKLKGFTGFRGGLDVKTDTTGSHSVYTKFRDGFEIMFHVSTLLPFQPDDLQRVERKRHLGNDVVVLIFKEGNTPFNPLCIKSHFNHVFLVVQVVKPEESLGDSNGSDAKTRYKLYIANKPGVVPHGPFLPFPPIFEKNEDFRDFLLTKLINAERAAMHAPDFKGKLIRTAKDLLTDIVKDIAKDKKYFHKGKSIFNFSTALDEAKETLQMLTPPNTARTMEEVKVSPRVGVSPREAEKAQEAVNGNGKDHSSSRSKSSDMQWQISPEDKLKFIKEFEAADEDKDGLITGLEAATIFINSGLSNDDLTEIWVLSDVDGDRHLDCEEFAIAKFLIQAKLDGHPLPDTLPPSLVPQRGKSTVSTEEKSPNRKTSEGSSWTIGLRRDRSAQNSVETTGESTQLDVMTVLTAKEGNETQVMEFLQQHFVIPSKARKDVCISVYKETEHPRRFLLHETYANAEVYEDWTEQHYSKANQLIELLSKSPSVKYLQKL